METFGITDLGTWIQDQEGQIFRLLTYKKVWTPYEMDKKYSDESQFEEGGYYKFVYITNAIEVPEGTLLELSEVMQEDDGSWIDEHIKHYRLLSDIRLEKLDIDNGYEEEED